MPPLRLLPNGTCLPVMNGHSGHSDMEGWIMTAPPVVGAGVEGGKGVHT
jgi:hypothetical protein